MIMQMSIKKEAAFGELGERVRGRNVTRGFVKMITNTGARGSTSSVYSVIRSLPFNIGEEGNSILLVNLEE